MLKHLNVIKKLSEKKQRRILKKGNRKLHKLQLYDKRKNRERKSDRGKGQRFRKRDLPPVGYYHAIIFLPYYFLILCILKLFNKFIYKKEEN